MERMLIPGSEWLFFKIYTGARSADNILINYIQPYTENLLAKKSITQFFFIRYTDPNFHIRLRLKISSKNCLTDVISSFYDIFNSTLKNGLSYRVQIDTYEREIERYGENTIEAIESFFYVDSYYMIKLLKLSNTDESKKMIIAIAVIDDILGISNFKTTQKKEFLEYQIEGFKKEFGINSKSIKYLDSKYRTNKVLIENIIEKKGHIYSEYQDILFKRCNAIKKIMQILITMDENIIYNVLPSLTHMTINRLFSEKSRFVEMEVYYLMRKYYYYRICRTNNT